MKRIKKIITVFILLSFLLLSLVVPLSKSQVSASHREIQKATDLINNNQILRLWQNESTRIGVGIVQNVICKYEESGALMTYADISVNVPLTDNLNSEQIVTVKYPGGQIGDKAIRATINWASFSTDTIIPPPVFELSKGMSIMFFEQQRNSFLVGYIPYTTAITEKTSSVALLSDPLPTTLVDESAGYGFGWTSGVHLHWDDMPRAYYIDPEGTADISGTDEFNTIHAAFSTWEQAPHSGADFTYGGTHDYDGWEAYDQDADGYSVVGWVLDYPTSSHIGVNFWKLEYESGLWHAIENDIMLNDDDYHWLIGNPFWWWEVDSQSILTHEVGHTLGLDDLEDASNNKQTMYYAYSGDTGPRSLEWGDLNGAHYLLPVHNDAASGGDGSDTFSGATTVQRNLSYDARLCNLPGGHSVDDEDYFKFYAPADMYVSIVLYLLANSDFDLELYDPSGQLVDYSRTNGNGIAEVINRNPIGSSSGFWRIRIYTTESDAHGDGHYSFHIFDTLSSYVSSITWYGSISGSGQVSNPQGLVGSSPNYDYAFISNPNSGDATAIIGYMSQQKSGTSHIYVFGGTWPGVPGGTISVYVSLNNNYDWYLVNSIQYTGTGAAHTIDFGTTTQTFRYVVILVQSNAYMYFDCVIAT